MTSAPDIAVAPFSESHDDFKRYALEFSVTNAPYRGYDKLVELASSYSFDDYDIYEAKSDGVIAGVAAVRQQGDVLYFDIFAVSEGFRAIGVGDALFAEIITQDKYSDATQYESMALPGDRSTKNFFEQRQGKARLLIVGGPINRDS